MLARTARVRSGVMLTLEDISAVEYLQRVKAWAPVAQKLAHGIKNPLGTIMGAVEQIESEVNKKQTIAEARSERLEARAEPERSEAKSQEPKGKTGNPQITPIKEDSGTSCFGTQGNLCRSVESVDYTPSADERVRKYIGYVKDEVTRLKKMTDAFMRFTKLEPPALESRNVNELIRKVVAKYDGALAKGISLELSLDEQLPLVALDENGIANVLDIVIENAIEAMSGGVGSRQNTVDRVLRIRTSTGPVGSRQDTADRVSDPGTEPRSGLGALGGLGGSFVRVEVEDTGAGIPQKYLDKVFDPYFTYGKADGTGLGLALARKIVEDHKGRMEIQSREGEGTTVAIILPTEASNK